MIEVRNQAELDKAMERPEIRNGDELVVILGNGRFVVSGGSPRLRAVGSPTVVTRETSSARVETWGTSNARGRAGGRSHLFCVRHDNSEINIPGAFILEAPEIKTAEDWIDYYGVEVVDGNAILYKAVDETYISSRSFAYKPGTQPACEDWDPDPTIAYGSGLDFCPAPSVAQGYNATATKFVACPIAVEDIVLSNSYGEVPNKVWAPKVSAPIWECDIDGERIKEAQSA